MSAPHLEEFFPDFYRAADRGSLDGQNLYVRSTRVQLFALVIAAFAGAVTWQFVDGGTDWAGVLAVTAFVIALFVRAFLWKERPERDWYAGRAAAESAKTLAWRFCIGAAPFPKDVPIEEATDVLIARLADIRKGLRGVVVLPPSQAGGQVTAEMISVRESGLVERKKVYLQQRIAGQRDWYASKSRTNLRLSRFWMSAMLGLEAVGVVGGVLKATGVMELDLIGLFGAVVAAMVAWSEMRQNSTLASAYSVAAQELSDVMTRASRAMSEDEWSGFAANAEEAISREHTMWAASRDA